MSGNIRKTYGRETEDFEEVKSVVNEWMWKYSDGHIWVVEGKKVIKHIILTA